MAPLDDLYGPGSSAAFLAAATAQTFAAPTITEFDEGNGRVRVNVAWGPVRLKMSCGRDDLVFLSLEPEPKTQAAQKWVAAVYAHYEGSGGIPGFFRERGVKRLKIADICAFVPTFKQRDEWGIDSGGISWEL